MSRLLKTLIIGGLLLIAQLWIFSDYISPLHWGEMKVRGLACTCPDETVISGKAYLKSTTPDSLLSYDLDYSEIFVSERPSTILDPMGVDSYIIKGRVVGKSRVSENDPWNPLVKIEHWRAVDIQIDWGIKLLLIVEIIIWMFLLLKARK